MNANNAYYLNFCVQAPVECFTSLVLTFFKHFVYLSFFVIFCFFGVSVHNRVATLVGLQPLPGQLLVGLRALPGQLLVGLRAYRDY